MMPFASPYGSPLYWSFHERPEAWHIDPFHQYAKQLVFFGGGRFTHSTHYHDSSLYGNHGTLTNMAPASDWVRDLGRWALDFDGSNDYVNCFAGSKLAGTEISIAIWAKAVSTANQSLLGAGGTQRINVHLSWGGTTCWDFGRTLSGGRLSKASPTITAWNHWCFQATGGSAMTIYLNGSLWASGGADASGYDGTGTFALGRFENIGGVSTVYFPGITTDALIYLRLLSPEEIKPLADPGNVMLSLGGSDPGLIVPDDLVYPVYLPSSVVAGAKPALWLGVCV